MHTMSLDMNTLQTDLGRIPAGSLVHLSLLMKEPPTAEQVQELTDALYSNGIEVSSPPEAMVLSWDGNDIPAIDLTFRNPATPDPNTVGLLPLLLGAAVLALGFGYVLWKGGQIAEETMQSLVKLVIPITLIIGGIYLVSTMSKRST